jgi:hypothetical protein
LDTYTDESLLFDGFNLLWTGVKLAEQSHVLCQGHLSGVWILLVGLA